VSTLQVSQSALIRTTTETFPNL